MKKNNKESIFKPTAKTTYDIPRFSYKSAFLICGVTFLLTCLDVWMFPDNRLSLILTLSLSVSILTGISQYFIDKKKGLCKGFFLTIVILFALCFGVLELLYR